MATRVLPFDEQTVLNMLSGALSFLNTYRRLTFPNVINSNDLISETFHAGNFNELPTSSAFNLASAYGQTSLAKACFDAYEVTQNTNWRSLGLSLLQAYVNYFFVDDIANSVFVSGGFQPSDIWFNHWLCVSKGTLPVTEGGQGDADNDSYNFGNFDTIVNFSNGVGVIPSGLQVSKVYKVYPTLTNLLSKNVFAPIAANPYQPQTYEYVIDYYVANYFLSGVNYRFYKNGTFTTTTETAGTIKLTTTFTGNAKVTWSDYTGGSVNAPNTPRQADGLIETFPIWHKCKRTDRTFLNSSFLAMWQAYDAFSSAFANTADEKWRRAYVMMQTTTQNLLIRNNYDYSHYYKKEYASYPFRYPGTNVLSINDSFQSPHSLTVSRETISDKLNCAKIQVNDTVIGNPSIRIQNLTVQTNISSFVKFDIELASTIELLVEIILSTTYTYGTRTDFSTDNDYSAFIVVPGDSTLRNTRLELENFINWKSTNIWNPVKNSPSAIVGTTGTGTATVKLVNDVINNGNIVALKANLSLGSDLSLDSTGNPVSHASIGLSGINLLETSNLVLPTFYYKLKSGSLKITIVDRDYNNFIARVPDYYQGWFSWTPTWDVFKVTNGSLTQGVGYIRNINFDVTSQSAEFYLYYVGETPSTIPGSNTSYKAVIVDKLKTPHTLWLGNFKPLANDIDNSQNLLGLVPFTNEIVRKNSTNIKNRWQDNGLYMAYLSPYHQKYFGYDVYTQNQLNLISNAQVNYYNQSYSRNNGLLTPVFLDTVWESSPFSYYGNKIINDSNTFGYEINKFSWKGGDFNTLTAKYAILPILSTARYLRLVPTNQTAQNIVTQFVKTIEPLTFSTPITNLSPNLDPASTYHNPSNAALIGLTAINANLAGIQPELTISIIKNCYNYLISQYQSVGSMSGAFCVNQTTFTDNGIVYKQYTAQYHADSISFLSQLIKHKNQLNIPATVTLGLFPAIAPTAVKSFKEAPYPKENLIFSDGNRQVLGYQKSKRGRTIEITYSAISPTDVQRLGQFWQLEGGVTDSFTLPATIPAFSRFTSVSWRFQSGFKFETKISTKTTGAYDVTIVLEQV